MTSPAKTIVVLAACGCATLVWLTAGPDAQRLSRETSNSQSADEFGTRRPLDSTGESAKVSDAKQPTQDDPKRASPRVDIEPRTADLQSDPPVHAADRADQRHLQLLPLNAVDPGSDKTASTDGAQGSLRGVEFATSSSIVEARARRCINDTENTACPAISNHLRIFRGEDRDQAWAARTETALRHVVETRDGGRFVVRSVECRTTICLLEVVSPTVDAFLGIREEEALTLDVGRGWADFAPESGPNLIREQVGIWSYFRGHSAHARWW
jgi:hypothetical protein